MVNATYQNQFQPVVARSAWPSKRYKTSEEWLLKLTPQHLDELRAAVNLHRDQPEAELHKLTANDFPLPTLGPALLELRDEIVNGKGFAVVKGLSSAEYSLRYSAAYLLALHAAAVDKVSPARACQSH